MELNSIESFDSTVCVFPEISLTAQFDPLSEEKRDSKFTLFRQMNRLELQERLVIFRLSTLLRKFF